MKKIIIDDIEYKLEKDYRDCFNLEEVQEKMTDYFYDYDYVFGDYSYDKLRLKGYYDSKNKKTTKINDIKYLEDYVRNYCAYDCKYFLLKKLN